MFSHITQAIESRTGIAQSQQHTHLSTLSDLRVIDKTSTNLTADIDPTAPDKALFSGCQFVISIQNDRLPNECGRLERAYNTYYESKPFHNAVTLLDIIEAFERFININDMQGYGNVITELEIIHSPVFAKCKEIAIQFE